MEDRNDSAATNPEPGPEAVVGGRILLLMVPGTNRDLLGEWLSSRYTVVETTDAGLRDTEFDLAIIDHPSHRRYHEALVARKAEAEPVLLPYLLVVPTSEAGTDASVWNEVEGVVEIPARKAELDARIRALLRTRRLSKELARQNERLEEFASIVSHDLRNPLNVIAGRTELARETGGDDHFVAIEHSVKRMTTLIEDLLSLARKGQVVEEPSPVALRKVSEDAWLAIDPPDATLDVTDDATFLADEPRLRELLENLFRNAVEHAGDDVAVVVGTCSGGFYVEDDGPGIPEEDRTLVFESGYSTSPTGTGFGLAIVKTITEAHGWTVAATEPAAGGARFEFTGVDVVE